MKKLFTLFALAAVCLGVNAQRPIVWEDVIENGGADYEFDQSIAFNGEDFGKVCAWGKEDNGDPHPAFIEKVDGNNVFVVHATAMTENPWDNQFWICAPMDFAKGEKVMLSFRYKAANEASVATQAHSFPSNYLHWQMLGDINFTTEWQTYSQQVEISTSGTQSIAFNLNDYADANDYYIDDISWKVMKLDEGYFVAGDFNDWNYDEAVQFTWDDEATAYVAVVGTVEKGASKIMISTKRGNDDAYQANSLKIKEYKEVTSAPGEWLDYEVAYQKLSLSPAGKWQISIDPEYNAMEFVCLEEGEAPQEQVETCRRLEIQTTDMAENPWDNQFFLVANRVLNAGEQTHIKFEVKAKDPASIGTQIHAGPGEYIHWAACGSVNFTDSWTTFEADYTVLAGYDTTAENAAQTAQTIAFNLNDYADANVYMFRNLSWTCGSEELLVNGDLASEELEPSFVVRTKEGGYGIITGSGNSIDNVNADVNKSDVMYNLNGQRVNKANGLVIRNGKIMFVK